MHRSPWLSIAAAAIAASGCQIPNTLGLPCNEPEHCNPGQHCGPEGTCLSGDPPTTPSTGTTTPLPDPSSSSAPSSGSIDPTVVLDDTSSSGSGSGSTTMATTASSDSTGGSCGQAVGTCDALDLLFVIDNSGSMQEDNNVLIPVLASLQGLLLAQVENMCSFHIGVTTTEPQPSFQPTECQVRGALSQAGVLCPDLWEGTDHPPWISEEDDISKLGCLFGVGENEEDDEKQFDTLLAALGPELAAPGACNEGFMREGVPLLIVMVTDEDDDDDSSTPGEAPDRTGSAGGPFNWWDQLTQIKDLDEMAMVLLASTDPLTCNWTPDSTDGEGAEFATNILDFAGYILGTGQFDRFQSVDLCRSVEEIIAQFSVIEDSLNTVCQGGMM
ncbi:MAG: hypothetical protein AAGF11_51345 [Myxococcota bacterium]